MSTIDSASERLGTISEASGVRTHAISRALRHLYIWFMDGWYAAEEIDRRVRQSRADMEVKVARLGRPLF